MTHRVPLFNHGQVVAHTLVDAADFAYLDQWRWSIDKTGYAWRAEYVRGSGRKHQRQRSYRMHRVIMGLGSWKTDPREVDHINRDRLDNRRSNLRICTHAEQAQNRKKTRNWRGPATSQYRGVAWSKHAKRWTVRVWHEGKNINGGYFATEEEANEAAIALRAQLMPFA